MSDSIAKLSVIITGDASPLGRATQQGTQFVRQFETQTTASMLKASDQSKIMSASFALANGNLRSLSSLLAFGWVGGIVIAAAASSG